MRAVVVFVLVLEACGGEVGVPDATASEGGDEKVIVEASNDATPDHSYLTIVDGGGDEPWCRQDPFDKTVFQACCDNAYCKGFCVAGDDGSVACSCFGVSGGCNGLKAAPKFRVVCLNGGCGIENCPPTQLCGPQSNDCCDPDQYCDTDAGDGGVCAPR